MSNFVTVPIVDREYGNVIGKVTIDTDRISKASTNWKLSLGFRTLEMNEIGEVVRYEPVCFCVVVDNEYTMEIIEE